MANDDFPVFAVVGHPNQGKSSVVATLVQDDHIAISPVSGTTREAHRYQLMMAGEVLYELVDTPGFQRARQVLDWCENESRSAADRPSVLTRFIDVHRDEPRFADDCALLEPVLRGAGIVYVVDSDRPFNAALEAEITLLAWTAQPRLALLNPFGKGPGEAGDCDSQWRAALHQYFSLVRTFNPLLASFEQHLSLLRGMAEIHGPWHKGLLRSVEALEDQRRARHRQAADLVAAYLQECLQYRLQIPMAGSREKIRETALEQYNKKLHALERALQVNLARLYGHSDLDWQIEWQSLATSDLTDVHEWRAWGLSRKRLASLSAAAGAMSGLAVDAVTGGASLFLGALVGGTLGGLAGNFAGRDPYSFQLVSKVPGYEQWQLGPVANVEFASVLAGRALRSWYQIRVRNHARRDAMLLEPQSLANWLEGLERKQQVQLVFWLRKLLKGRLGEEEQTQLQSLLLAVGEQMEVQPEIATGP